MSRSEMEAVAAKARNEERWVNQLMPEKNWGIDSPATWAMAAAILVLFYFNDKKRTAQELEEAERAREQEKAARARKRLRQCKQLLETVDALCSQYPSPEDGAHCHDTECVDAIAAVAAAGNQCDGIHGWPERSFVAAAHGACPRP